MLDWIVLTLGIVLGSLVLFRPRLLGLPETFPGSALLGFLLLSIGMTAPLVVRPEAMMLDAGAETDAYIGAWNLWWTAEALTTGQNPWATNLLFAPEGTDLSLHTHAVTSGILAFPLLFAFGSEGPPGLFGVYNLVVLLSFTLTAYFGYRLARTLTGDRHAAILAAVLLAYSNFRFANTVRLHVLSMEWLVLLVWTAVLLGRKPTPWRLTAFALAGVLLLNASLELSAHAAVLLAAGLTFSGTRRLLARTRTGGRRAGAAGRGAETTKEPRSNAGGRKTTSASTGRLLGLTRPAASARTWWAAGVVLAVAAMGSVPLLVRLLSRLGDRPAFDPRLAVHFSADLVDFILPNPRHPFGGAIFAAVTGRLHLGDDGFGQSLGVVTLALFAFAGWQIRRARRGRCWWWGTIVCLLLALGPTLHVNGESLGSWFMPQAVLAKIVPVLGLSRTPLRWMAPASLCLAMAVAWGWTCWRSRRTAEVRATLAAYALVLFAALAAPLRFEEVSIPDVYHHVSDATRGEGGRAALLHLPGMLPREALLYQTVHGQRLVEDVSPAVPLHTASLAALSDPRYAILVRDLGRPGALAALGAEGTTRAVADLRAYLADNGIAWIVVPSDPGLHEWAVGSLFPPSAFGQPLYQAYRENLRLLRPVDEVEIEGWALFRF